MLDEESLVAAVRVHQPDVGADSVARLRGGVADEGDRVSVGRPGGVDIAALRVRQVPQTAAIGVDDSDLRFSGNELTMLLMSSSVLLAADA